MPAYAVSVEKDISFRNGTERIGNVYHYRIDLATQPDFENLADAVLARDRAAYPSVAAFKQLRIWGPTEGSEADNKMRLERSLNVNGLRTATSVDIYPELSVVCSIFVGRSPVHNRKVFVRKYIRLLRPISGTTSGITSMLDTADINHFKTWMNGNKTISAGTGQFSMCTPLNRVVPEGEDAKVLPTLRVRQIKQ